MRTNPFSDRNVSIQESKQKRLATKERTREIGKTQGKREDREKERKGRRKREREREKQENLSFLGRNPLGTRDARLSSLMTKNTVTDKALKTLHLLEKMFSCLY